MYIVNKATVIQIALLLTYWMPYKSVTYQRIKKNTIKYITIIYLDLKYMQ